MSPIQKVISVSHVVSTHQSEGEKVLSAPVKTAPNPHYLHFPLEKTALPALLETDPQASLHSLNVTDSAGLTPLNIFP